MATDHLDAVYNINERIQKLQEQIKTLEEKNSRKGKAVDVGIARRIDDLNVQISELIAERNREMKKIRWSDKPKPRVPPTKAPVVEPEPPPVPRVPTPVPEVIKRVLTPPHPRIPTPPPRIPTPPPRIPTPPPPPRVPTPVPSVVESILIPSTLKVIGIDIGVNSTTMIMIPTWFNPDDPETALNGIVYPPNTTEHNQFKTVARFRKSTGKSNDFSRHSLDVSEKSTEMLVLSLEAFAQQFGGQLSFTTRDLPFDNSAENAACGVPNLGSAHLLANDHAPTANFVFNINLDYDQVLARSTDTMGNFVTNFSVAIAQVLGCKNDYVRVFSVHKSTTEQGTVEVYFGLTTPDEKDTESFALALQGLAKAGFGENEVLRLILLREYECKWRSVLSYLELRPDDFDTRFNFDYTQPGLPAEQQRANQPYFLPLGWYRHALNVSQKYTGDTLWLGHNNSPGEWPAAFHGTHSGAVGNIIKSGLSSGAVKRDRMLEEAIQQKGPSVNRSGLYLATHCDGGSEAYATTFTVKNDDKTETFQVVFQCRVRPGSFTTHTSCVSVGHGWRIVDLTAVRPYGLLLRKKQV